MRVGQAEEIIQDGPVNTPGIFDAFIEEADAPTTFTVDLPDGTKVAFKNVCGRKQLKQWRKSAREQAESFTIEKVPPAWKPWFPEDDKETVFWCCFLDLACPDATTLDFLKLQKARPVLFEIIMQEVQAHHVGFTLNLETDEIDESKKG